MVVFWKELFFARAFSRIIDRCQLALFGWESTHIRTLDKIIAYQHLYAFTSSKLIVHWFQIMRAGRFQMYDEGSPVQIGSGHVVPRYTLDAISTKIALFLGGRDTLVDNSYTKEHLGDSVIHVTEIEEYEHLDFLWASDLDTRVYPAILRLMNEEFMP
jgi:lysosomal acid lipase/cholesteryl ester hydrolase